MKRKGYTNTTQTNPKKHAKQTPLTKKKNRKAIPYNLTTTHIILIILLLVIIDQLTKLPFTTTINYGGAFGLFQNSRILFIFISILVIVLASTQIKNKKYQFPLTLIIAGSLGNLIDRIFLGYVRDFISLPFWPTFNFADFFLTLGFLWLIIILIKKN